MPRNVSSSDAEGVAREVFSGGLGCWWGRVGRGWGLGGGSYFAPDRATPKFDLWSDMIWRDIFGEARKLRWPGVDMVQGYSREGFGEDVMEIVWGGRKGGIRDCWGEFGGAQSPSNCTRRAT